mmetsp:Transcript_33808/g.60395  ORF Transcript_33808/g.60395 Transcript_33808/m.60395 type:complete len:470 (-) Transcript_33808:392-1801(-)|eukprot:CAMPEP_0177751096 /NCGR_PEP_ID=MMETSP0491_2-20121128/189_1 /TAXON_ID=63592 /ORGANISM="Tetraselmis chuii, Strain PLY429" /LENGTH=469 /DNA_ID=CAMNT_0019266181 /DNA_START=83 /DNA_END=1492 /DNA_ORIENTATION=+
MGSSKKSGGDAGGAGSSEAPHPHGSTERVLKAITELYAQGLSGGAPGATGLVGIADDPVVGAKIMRPRKKISVMIVGNHSAGKSSFVNWYIGEEVQRTGVAIETRGFTLITSGKRRETLTGDATLRFFEYLEGFDQFEGIRNNLFTEVCTSKARDFNCVSFVDTPGLVDGDMQYPFNVQDSIVWLADHVDLILVFFDPIGQATCKRTMEVVERLNHGPNVEKIYYFMSKADEVKKEHDRQRVLIQITQNLTPRIKNMHAFNLPTFYLPREGSKDLGIPNSIDEVCTTIQKGISYAVQKNLNNLKIDCNKLLIRLDEAMAIDLDKNAQNRSNRIQGICLTLMYVFMLLWIMWVVLEEIASTSLGRGFISTLPDPAREMVLTYMPDSTRASRGEAILGGLLRKGFVHAVGVMSVICTMLWVASKVIWKVKPVMSKKEINRIINYKGVVLAISKQEPVLYKEYLGGISSGDH